MTDITTRELRDEAKRLRGLAGWANPKGDGHWFARCDFLEADFPGPQWRTRARLWTSRFRQIIRADDRGAGTKSADPFGYIELPVAEYIAAVNPAVGLAFARLLDRAADHHAQGLPCCDDIDACPVVAPALDVVAALKRARALAAAHPALRASDPEEPLMTRREPTIHNRALMVTCPRCGCVPGARCMDTRGRWLKDGKAHQDRAELYLEHEAARQEREAQR